mgnify:FL=1
MFGVPESTLRDRTLGLQPVPHATTGYVTNSGPSPMFSKIEENQLFNLVSYISKIGYGYSRKEFTHLATDFAISLKNKGDAEQPFGNSWFNGYKARHPQLILTKPQKLSVVRAKATLAAVLQEYFTQLDLLLKLIKENGVHERPECIWDMDETGLQMEHSPSKVVCLKGSQPVAITSSRGKTITIIAGGNAAGVRI